MSAEQQSTEFPYSPDRWEESIIAERFLYSYCTPEEANIFRAFGRYVFHRALEHGSTSDRGESQIVADLRGAARDMRLLYRFLHNAGEGMEVADIAPPDRQYILHAGSIAMRLEELTQDFEAILPLKNTPQISYEYRPTLARDERKWFKPSRRDWAGELERRRQRQIEAEAKVEQALT